MYLCVCHTCEEEQLVDDIERAQAMFNDHAADRHEVELINLDTELGNLRRRDEDGFED